MLVEVKADFRSVCRLFWNQTVTDRSSLHMSGLSRVKWQRVISKRRNPRYADPEFRAGENNLQIAFVREIFALLSGRMAGFVEQLFKLHDLSLGEAFPGSFDFVSRDGRRIV